MFLYVPQRGCVAVKVICDDLKLVESPLRQLLATDLKSHSDTLQVQM